MSAYDLQAIIEKIRSEVSTQSQNKTKVKKQNSENDEINLENNHLKYEKMIKERQNVAMRIEERRKLQGWFYLLLFIAILIAGYIMIPQVREAVSMIIQWAKDQYVDKFEAPNKIMTILKL